MAQRSLKIGGTETGREPLCAHCGEKCFLHNPKDVFQKKEDLKKHAAAIYFCTDCRAWCWTSGVRALGTPATDELHQLREDLKGDIQKLIARRVKRGGITPLDASVACNEWIRKSLRIEDFDPNRLTWEEAIRLDDILERYF